VLTLVPPRGARALQEQSAALWSAAETALGPEAVPGSVAGARSGVWVGAPSVVRDGGVFHLAYRPRLPVGEGRGYATVLATSGDGVRFTTVGEVGKDRFGAESLERPALVRTDDGWRLYVSAATPGTKHWRVDLLEAGSVEELGAATPRTVLPGSDAQAVKDPVVRHDGRRWHLWASVHPLDDPDATDRMTTEHATSTDGVTWTWQGTALAGTPGSWDARGVRFTTVLLDGDATWALYDGRASAEENWEERTGLARRAADGRFTAVQGGPLLESPHRPGGLRYADAVRLPDGRLRWFYEATRADGAHELRTVLLPG
jgi:hypothetical protein